jgi:hypothetical protein
MEGSNTERLREAGIVEDDPPLPPEYYDFLESLSEDEIELLVGLKRRLDDAGIPTQVLTSKALVPVL